MTTSRMPQSYRNGELVIVIDCSDLERSAQFWASVPEDKRQKNRLHLDLRTAEMDAEVSRILGLGATLLLRPPDGDGIAAQPG